MQKTLTFTALLAALALGACGTPGHMKAPGSLNGLGNEPMSMMVVHKNPDYGDWQKGEWQVVVDHAKSCFIDTKRQMSSVAEAAATGAVVYGAPAFAVAPYAMGEFPASSINPAVHEIGVLNAVNGAVYGVIAKSNAVVSAVSSCTSEDLKDVRTMAKAPGVHAVAAMVRTSNNSDKTPSWAQPPNQPQPHN